MTDNLTAAEATRADGMCPIYAEYSLATRLRAIELSLALGADDTSAVFGAGSGETVDIGSVAAGAVTMKSNAGITIGNAEANSLTLSGGAGLASLDGTTVAVGPATTSTIAIGSAVAGAVSISSNSTITIGNAEANSITITSAGALDLAVAGQMTTVKGTLNVDQAASFDAAVQLGATATAALAIGGGTSGTPLTSASTGKNFGGFWTQSTDATGSDMRGLYWKHTLAGAGGAQSGEAGRFLTSVTTSAANAARGIHSSLSFGASGDIAGLGAALDATLHVPNASLGGTAAAVSADINADGASSDAGGTMSFYRASIQGDGTGVTALELTTNLMHLSGFTAGVGNLFHVNTAADATHGLKINVAGVPYAIMLTSVIPA